MRIDTVLRQRALITILTLIVIHGCGSGGSSDPSRNGAITMQVRWQGEPLAVSSAATDAGCVDAEPVDTAGFGVPIPPAARFIRIVYVTENSSCCVAFPNRSAVVAERRVVLSGLSEDGDVIVSGTRPTSLQPTALPPPAQRICPPHGHAWRTSSPPSFSSGRTFVKPIPGTLVDAGDIPVFALPFVVLPDDARLQPRPRQADAPQDLRFTVADAVGFIDPNRLDAVVIQITRNGQTIPIEPDSETGVIVCADATRNPSPNDPRCSALDDLRLRGLRIVASNLEIGSGPATLTITARDENGCHSTASFDFIFGIPRNPTPTVTPTPTPTLTPTLTVTQTMTPTPTPTPCKAGDEPCTTNAGTADDPCCSGFSCQSLGSSVVCLACLTAGSPCSDSNACCSGLECQPAPQGSQCATPVPVFTLTPVPASTPVQT